MNASLHFLRSLATLPNLLTGFRFVAAPGLLAFAWSGHDRAFIGLLALVFLSDMLDGIAARLTGQVTEFGAALDSLADLLTYLTIALCSFWLWPDLIEKEMIYVLLIVASCIAPPLAGMIKFGRVTSYHTWLVKLAAVAVGGSLFVMLFGGPVWPFRYAAILSLLAGIEEILITHLLFEPVSNIRSLWNVLKTRGRGPSA